MAILDATQMNAGNIYGGRASIEDKVRYSVLVISNIANIEIVPLVRKSTLKRDDVFENPQAVRAH